MKWCIQTLLACYCIYLPDSEREDEELEKKARSAELLSRLPSRVQQPKKVDSSESKDYRPAPAVKSSSAPLEKASSIEIDSTMTISSSDSKVEWDGDDVVDVDFLEGNYGNTRRVMHPVTKEIAVAKDSYEFLQGKSKYLSEDYIWNKVNGHPHIQQLYTTIPRSAHRCCFISEYLPRGDLRSFIKIHKVLQMDVARVLTAQITSAILFIHSKEVFHRDVSNKNILISAEGKAKLSNFTNSLVNKTSRGLHGHILYQAPEVFSGKIYDMSADWYSLGACLYEMVMSLTPVEHHCMRRNINFNTLDYTGKLVVILTSSLYMPQIFPEDLKKALEQFLMKDNKQRLGYNNDIKVFKKHPFFSNIDWKSLEDGLLTAVLPKAENQMWWEKELDKEYENW